jgi:hypothetical protein
MPDSLPQPFRSGPLERTVTAMRGNEHVYVIRHQHIGMYVALMFFACLIKPSKIGAIVVVDEEYRLSIVAALNDMLWYSRELVTAWARHWASDW